ncbi:MAG TPA: CHAD domain-containing protein [candidate division Zixibacteria bacterium]|nr:CHAD domain-containing protein [candidate division Zixibacteria bacterium]
MLPQGFIEYHAAREKSIRAEHTLVSRFPSVDGVHELRVEIKRLRAFYQLVGWICKQFKDKTLLKETRKLFKAADKLRDLHVQIELTRDWMRQDGGNLSEYYNSLVAEQWHREEPFAVVCRKYDPGTLGAGLVAIRKALAEMTEPDVLYRADLRFAVLARELIKFSAEGEWPEKVLHQIRIKTKAGRYVLEVLTKCRDASEQDSALNDLLRSSQQALGRWHDRVVGLDRFRNFSKDKPEKYFFDYQASLRFGESLNIQRDVYLADFRRNWIDLEPILQNCAARVDAY